MKCTVTIAVMLRRYILKRRHHTRYSYGAGDRYHNFYNSCPSFGRVSEKLPQG